MSRAASDVDRLAINTIRTLSMDAVEKANSGHPGTPMALAPVAFCLWQRFLRFDPNDPLWPNRDRFVLSAGHASMLLYSLLHLAEVKQTGRDRVATDELAVTLEAIKSFRQLESRTPGHPEYDMTSGVETTTGPLGQGVSVSVGMAIAGRWLAERFNRPGYDIFEYDVYALASDGDMMEGISSEAASLAGHLRLPNLCWIYDNNHISIDGSTELAFSERVGDRFRAYGWQVIHVEDANDLAALDNAYTAFQEHSDGPTMIVVDSHIAYGAPTKQDTAEAHGSPLGEDDIRGAKKFYGWPEDKKFWVPDEVRDHFAAGVTARGSVLRDKWMEKFAAYGEKYPDLASQIEMMQRRELPAGWDEEIPSFEADEKGIATRAAGGKVLNAIARKVPWLIGGAADLTPSTKTYLEFEEAGGDLGPDNHGARNLRFGVREHSMGAILNGLAHCDLRPFGATFLIFSDYMRPPTRLAALMELPVIYVFTHDSIGLGEDGPTHQPVEQLVALRAIPNLIVLRPCDANETAEAWRVVMQLHDRPAALALTRQKLPVIDRSRYAGADGLRRGAYVLAGPDEPEVVLIASGSEVVLALRAYEQLTAEGINARVVSMPSRELFEEQEQAYRDSVLPPACGARMVVEAAVGLGWDRYVGPTGGRVVQETFGASAPAKDAQRHFGFTVENVVSQAKKQIKLNR